MIVRGVWTRVGPNKNRMPCYYEEFWQGIRWPGLAKEILMSASEKTFDYYFRETAQARKDQFLVNLVGDAHSAESADAQAEKHDYPTYLCRQARLLYQFHEHPAWDLMPDKNGFFENAKSYMQNFSMPVLVHIYPCEWSIEEYQGIIKSTHDGLLVVTKNAAKAALLWDYSLVDEDGQEVCHSKDLGRDFFLREDLAQVNCYINCGSMFLPRMGTTIVFSRPASALSFRRTQSSHEICWKRYVYTESANDNKQELCITRSASGGNRAEMKYEVCLKPLSKFDKSHMSGQTLNGEWGLFITSSFLKRSSNPPGFDQFPRNKDVPLSVLCYVTTVYTFHERKLEKFLSSDVNYFWAERSLGTQSGPFRSYDSTWDIGIKEISPQEQSMYEGMYMPQRMDIEDVLLSLRKKTPFRIDGNATIQQICDIRKIDIDLFSGEGNNMLVKL